MDQDISASYSIPTRVGLKERRMPVLRFFIGNIGELRQLSHISPNYLNSKGGIRILVRCFAPFFKKVGLRAAK